MSRASRGAARAVFATLIARGLVGFAGAAALATESLRLSFSPSPSPASALQTPAAPTTVHYRVRPGAEVDLGWTGLAHDSAWPADQRLAFDLTCAAGAPECAVSGGARGVLFGAPVALASGGVPVCVVNRLREPHRGTVNAQTGCGAIELRLTASVFQGGEVARPCPRCVGDATPHDGRAEGHCDGGAHAGASCDAHGTSPVFGSTSNDCLPNDASRIGELAVDLAPMTTGPVRVTAQDSCARKLPSLTGTCFCRGQAQANECASGSCGPGERCADGPIDGVCSNAPYRSCRPETGGQDCENVAAGSGTCRARPRPCFGETIEAHGRCDPSAPTYVAVFCTPATRAPAVNTTAGLPGPTRLSLPLEQVLP